MTLARLQSEGTLFVFQIQATTKIKCETEYSKNRPKKSVMLDKKLEKKGQLRTSGSMKL